MTTQPQIFALIPARGGSKGVPRKNLRPVAGKPLIVYSIESALRSPSIARVIVSTDDPEIAAVSKAHGAEAPFLRPAELSTDTAATLPVVLHGMRWFESAVGPCEAVVLLQPTSPFRSPDLVEEVVRVFREKEFDMVLTLREPPQHPYWMKTIRDGQVESLLKLDRIPSRRQDLPPAYIISGSVYVWSRRALLRRDQPTASGATQFPDERVGAVFVDGEYVLDLETELDFQLAEMIARDKSGSGTRSHE